jgi:hypothetical protein
LPRWLRFLASGARFAAASFFGCLATAVFYAATFLALYVVGVVVSGDMGGPLFAPLAMFGLFLVGLFVALIVYTPLTLLTAALSRERMWIWLTAPALVVVLSFGAGLLIATRVQSADPIELWSGRLGAGVVLPYFFAGGYCLYWLFLFTPCQLGPWLVRRLEKG